MILKAPSQEQAYPPHTTASYLHVQILNDMPLSAYFNRKSSLQLLGFLHHWKYFPLGPLPELR